MPKKPTPPLALIPVERIEQRIYLIRGHKVMLDADLAKLYQVPTKRLNEAIRRNRNRFPEDFMFQLTSGESSALRSQIATLKTGRGRYSKYAPYAFTEHGVAMLSSVLRSKRAVEMNILIIRAFIRLREILASHKELAQKVVDLERTQQEHAIQIDSVYNMVNRLIESPTKPKRRIGFVRE
jgi:ORF6N domain-containing protein